MTPMYSSVMTPKAKPTPARSANRITKRSIRGNRYYDCECGWSESVGSWSTVEAIQIAERHVADHLVAHDRRDGYWHGLHGYVYFDSPVAS